MRPSTWVPFLLVCFFGGAIFNIPVMLILSVSVGIILAVAGWWQRHSLDQVVYQRRWHFSRGFPGEETTLKIQIQNNKLLPVSWLRVSDPWPRAVGPGDLSLLAPSHIADQGFLTHIFNLRWFEKASRKYTLRFRQRGYYPVGPPELASGDLFGIYERKCLQGNSEALTVFPELLAFPDLGLQTEDPFGDRHARRRLFEDPNQPMGVRLYHPEDDFRRVHWPATARTGDLQVKIYQSVSSQVIMLCLNVATFPHYWEGTYPVLLEQLIKVTATIAYESVQQGYAVGLMSNGCLAHADRPFRLSPGRSPRQLAQLLQALAEVSPFMTAPFERYLLKAAPEIPYGATLVLVTGLVTPELVDTLFRLKKFRRNMTLVSLEDNPPPAIPGVRSVHLPFKD
ncbi:MAG: DUF58 domain-containing protein [Anaerolineaceae bacterium]|nr:DUF58 domain-containing protein [Anaerolineaceae bacterium]